MLLRALVRYGYAPFMLLGFASVAYWVVADLVVAGGNKWAYLGLIPVVLLAYATAFAAERIAPYFDEWNDNAAHGDTPSNFIHVLIYEYQAISGVTTIPLLCWLFPYQGLWPIAWPMWAQVVMAFLISDFGFMMVHYFSHRYAILWRLHSVHHGVGRLYGFNGVQRHPLNAMLNMAVANAPLVVIGMPATVAVMLGIMITLTLIVQHSNVDIRLGPLQKWLSFGRLHHMHHVNWGTEGDCNFGLFLTVWDHLLGTFKDTPARPITAADLGIDEVPNFPKGYLEQLLFPFIYRPGRGEPKRYSKARTPAQEARILVEAAE